jgi:hypothetical protein
LKLDISCGDAFLAGDGDFLPSYLGKGFVGDLGASSDGGGMFKLDGGGVSLLKTSADGFNYVS